MRLTDRTALNSCLLQAQHPFQGLSDIYVRYMPECEQKGKIVSHIKRLVATFLNCVSLQMAYQAVSLRLTHLPAELFG